MIHRIEIYLDQVLGYAGLAPAEASESRNELADHLLSRVAELENEGASRDDAALQAVHEHGHPSDIGYGLRPLWPWVDVRMRGTARGVFAVGPKAVGVFACGYVSTGIVSCGVVSFGVLSIGLISCALFLGMGVISIGAISLGVNTLGLISAGLNSAGVLCAGQNCAGIWVFNAQNAFSYFDEQSVPYLLNHLSLMFSWNLLELIVGLAPFIALVALTLTASVVAFAREYSRVQTNRRWITR
jgi:hypothetical protein